MQAYEALLQAHGTDYGAVKGVDVRANLRRFFGRSVEELRLPHHQDLDLEGLKGRVRSCSYVPKRGEPGHDALMRGCEELFEQHAEGGVFILRYETVVFRGALGQSPSVE